MYIDSHAHITSKPFLQELDLYLERAQQAGLEAICNICTDQESLEQGLALARRCPWVYNIAATTPHDVEKEGEMMFPVMAEAARSGQLIAVGETGLDYYYEHSPRKKQQELFIRYLHLAQECHLPVVIHCRDAFTDFFSIIDQEHKKERGVLHCFTGTKQEAIGVIDRGWYISLSGIVTYKKSELLREIAQLVPLDRLLIETDSPYLAPQPFRGKQNEPSFLPETAKVIAECRGISLEQLAQATTENTKKIFEKIAL